jgi:hypothetical protein
MELTWTIRHCESRSLGHGWNGPVPQPGRHPGTIKNFTANARRVVMAFGRTNSSVRGHLRRRRPRTSEIDTAEATGIDTTRETSGSLLLRVRLPTASTCVGFNPVRWAVACRAPQVAGCHPHRRFVASRVHRPRAYVLVSMIDAACQLANPPRSKPVKEVHSVAKDFNYPYREFLIHLINIKNFYCLIVCSYYLIHCLK